MFLHIVLLTEKINNIDISRLKEIFEAAEIKGSEKVNLNKV